MTTYRMVYGDDETVVRETYQNIDDIQREDGWLILFRGRNAILRVQEQHVHSIEETPVPARAVVDVLSQRNAGFATHQFSPELRMLPVLKTILLGCVDPRVDPAQVLSLDLGEAAIMRNVGGRVTPGVLHELAMLRGVTQAQGGDFGPAWNLVVLQHTDCGITRLAAQTDLLAAFFNVAPGAVPQIDDPVAAVERDVAAIRSQPQLPAGCLVSGLVYDVATGSLKTVVDPSPLRPGA